MSTFSVGDRVQFIGEDLSIRDGELTAIIPPERETTQEYWKLPQEEQDKMEEHALVKWDDGSESKEMTCRLDKEDSKLERQFRLESNAVSNEINKKVAEASKALDEAVKLSEKHGIPFDSNISFLSQSYTPSTLSAVWEDLDADFVESVTGVDPGGEYSNEGWEHSAVCY